MLCLTNTKARFASMNTRAEKHGEERVPASDLKFRAMLPGSELIELHASLRSMLWKRQENPDLIDQADPEALSVLRFPHMGSFMWAYEGVGYKLEFDYGMGGASNIVIDDCKVDKIKLTPMEGGMVEVEWRVIIHPAEHVTGKLHAMLQTDVVISLTPPAPNTAADLFRDAA